MRDLKFRAFCEVEIAGSPSGNIMVYFSHIELDNGLWYNPDDENIYHINEWLSKPMQFTGLTDKNGKEIYEGDLVKSNGDERVYKIKYSDKYASFVLVYNEGIVVYNINASILEIIGNIHEHGHLLK